MRRIMWAAALFVGLGLASSAWAQQATSFFGGVNPADIKFVPVDTSKVLLVPIPGQEPSSFSLLNFFSKFSLTNLLSKPKFGVSNLPPPSSFPSTQYKSPIYPVAPINPGR